MNVPRVSKVGAAFKETSTSPLVGDATTTQMAALGSSSVGIQHSDSDSDESEGQNDTWLLPDGLSLDQLISLAEEVIGKVAQSSQPGQVRI